jgi:tetratricopeptide (TPR) repeat protein
VQCVATLHATVLDELLTSVYNEEGDPKTCRVLMLGKVRALVYKAQLQRAAAKLDTAVSCTAEAIELLSGVAELLQVGSAAKSEVLEHVASAYAWHGIICSERSRRSAGGSAVPTSCVASVEATGDAMAAFTELLQCDVPAADIPSPSWLESCDVENAWNNLQALSDFYCLAGNCSLHMHCLALRYRLVSLCVEASVPIGSGGGSRSFDLADIVAEMSCLHTRLGFSERAAELAEHAGELVSAWDTCRFRDEERGACDRVAVKVQQAQLLSACRARHVCELQSNADKLLSSTEGHRGRAWNSIRAACNTLCAESRWCNGDQSFAMQAAMEALQSRSYLLPGCKELMAPSAKSRPAEGKATVAQSIHDDDDDDGTPSIMPGTDDGDEDSHDIDSPPGGAAMQANPCDGSGSQWGLIRNILESLRQTGCYAAACGRGPEGEAYLGAALNIAERVGADHWQVTLLYDLAYIHYRRRNLDACVSHVERALGGSASHCLTSVRALALQGDCHRKRGAFDDAISSYTAAYSQLETMRGAKFLDDTLYSVNVGARQWTAGEMLPSCADIRRMGSKAIYWPYQLEQLQAMVEAKHGRALAIAGETEKAHALYKRALGRSSAASPQRAVALYYAGCLHYHELKLDPEKLWSIHAPGAAPPTKKPKPKKSAGRGKKTKVAATGAVGPGQRATCECLEESLQLAWSHGMAGLAAAVCHRLARVSGRGEASAQARSCQLQQTSLCVPLCRHMESISKRHAGPAASAKPDASDIFSVGAMLCSDSSNFQQSIDLLPSDWTVCSCTVERSHATGRPAALLVSRMMSQKTPLVVRIPLFSTDEGEEVSDRLGSITSAWDNLIQGNISSLKCDAIAKDKKKHSAAQKAAWWCACFADILVV